MLKNKLRSIIERDRLATDLKISLFSAALRSFRYDSVLRPFPRVYIKFGEKQTDLLRKSFHQIPSIDELCQEETRLSPHSLELLEWLLIEDSDSVYLKILPVTKLEEILQSTGFRNDTTRPSLIFDVINKERGSSNRFNELKRQYGSFYGYHGSSIENFFSILHTGLLSHLNNRSLFGEGIYLSTDLDVSLNFSATGSTWEKSMIAKSISCVAVCEIVKHPRIVADKNKKRPEKYIIIQDNDCLKIRFLLLYPAAGSVNNNQSATARPFFVRYIFFIVVVVYLVALIWIGFSSKRKFNLY